LPKQSTKGSWPPVKCRTCNIAESHAGVFQLAALVARHELLGPAAAAAAAAAAATQTITDATAHSARSTHKAVQGAQQAQAVLPIDEPKHPVLHQRV
jgi:hypothetical protein